MSVAGGTVFGVPDLSVALAGGAIGAVIAAGFGQAGRARAAWDEVALHDEDAAELNAQLLAWVDDRTRELVREMDRRTGDYNSRGQFYSGAHGAALADAKGIALHEFRDEQWRATRDLAALRASEGPWHAVWRRVRRHKPPMLTEATLQDIELFLERWREPVVRHHGQPPGEAEGIRPVDRTRRTIEQALAELHMMKLR